MNGCLNVFVDVKFGLYCLVGGFLFYFFCSVIYYEIFRLNVDFEIKFFFCFCCKILYIFNFWDFGGCFG